MYDILPLSFNDIIGEIAVVISFELAVLATVYVIVSVVVDDVISLNFHPFGWIPSLTNLHVLLAKPASVEDVE